jgi:hypothetical protein
LGETTDGVELDVRRLNTRALFLSLLVFFAYLCSSSVQAVSVLANEIPDFFSRPDANLIYRGLGTACIAMRSVRFVLACNPAFADTPPLDTGDVWPYSRESDRDTRRLFAADLFFGNDYSTLKEINQILNGPHSQDFVNDLFSKHQVIEAEASGEFTLRDHYFGLAFEPIRLTYFSVIRNEANPVIAIHAMQERTVRGQVGGEVEKGVYAGVQLRWVHREFVQDEFKLVDALTDPDTILQKHEQNLLLLEPGLAYTFEHAPWKPRASFMLSNIGYIDHNFDQVNTDPVYDIGIGASPELPIGDLDMGLNYRASRSLDNNWDQLRLGVSYTYGLLNGLLGADPRGFSIGILTSFWLARIGIVYNNTKIDTLDGNRVTDQTTFTEFSLVF